MSGKQAATQLWKAASSCSTAAREGIPGKLVQRADLEGKVRIVDQDIDGAELFTPSRPSSRLALSASRRPERSIRCEPDFATSWSTFAAAS